MELRDYLEGEMRLVNDEYIFYVPDKLKPFSKELIKYMGPKKNKIVYFLNLSTFRKIQINLFSNKDNYTNYTEKLRGNTNIRNSINYYISDDHLEDASECKKDILEITCQIIRLIILETNKEITPWLSEGIIQNISGVRDNISSKEAYIKWLEEKNILNIQNIKDYDRLDIAYFLVRYLLETTTKEKLVQIVLDKETCKSIEKSILPKAVLHYKSVQAKQNEINMQRDLKEKNKVEEEYFHGNSEGTNRKDIYAGLRVKIVLKKDQPTGLLTEGVVARILTNSQEHHRGIKVMLEDGSVGRVQKIIG